jgi:hypothetical protein
MTEVVDYSSTLKTQIEAAYRRSGNDLGWRLLYSPASVLDGAQIAFIGLNPGGSVRPVDHSEFSMASGSAYVVEKWGNGNEPGQSPLQKQVRALFHRLEVEPDQVLAGNLVPFRSPSWDRLENQHNALQFGENIWNEIFQRVRPKLVIGLGGETFSALSRILSVYNVQSIPVGWGNVSGTRALFKGGSLVGLPHLFRFGVGTRVQSAAPLRELFGEYWSG